jgi:hypothetical protein
VLIMSGREAPNCHDSGLRHPIIVIFEIIYYGTFSARPGSVNVVRLPHQLLQFCHALAQLSPKGIAA